MKRKNNKTKDFLQNDDPNYIKFQQRRAQLCDLIRDVYSGANSNLPVGEVHKKYRQMLDCLVNKNPYFDRYEYLKVYPSARLGGDTLGEYDPKLNYIEISQRLLYETLISGEKPLAELFNTIGHEMGHELQKKEIDKIVNFENVDKNLSDDTKSKIQTFIDDFNSAIVDEYAIRILTAMLEQRLGKKIEHFTGQDEQRKMDMCKEFALLLYFQTEHERDARKIGYEFANFMIDSLSKEEHLEKHIREDLVAQKTYLSSEKSKEDSKEKLRNPFHEIIDEAIENMTAEEFVEVVRDIEKLVRPDSLFDVFEVDQKALKEISHKARLAIEYLNFEICRGKSADAVMDYIMDSCVAGCSESISRLISALKEKKDFTKEKLKQLKVNVADLLTDRDLPIDVHSADYTGLFDDNEKCAIFSYLINEEKDMQAFAFYGRNFLFHNGIAKNEMLAKKVIQRFKNFVERCKRSGKVSSAEKDEMYRGTFIFNDETNQQLIENLNNEIKRLIKEKKISYMTDEEEREYLKAKYGETFADDIYEKKQRDHEMFESYLRDYRKKRREETISSGRLLGEEKQPS